jgi:predicted ArsR family transcriptional regulator
VRLPPGIRSISALADRLRERIYVFVRSQGRPVTREEVAEAVGISRKLAAFHLDKLLERGLLQAHYARPAGRSGPGAGRSAKMYEPSELEVSVSIPERRYDLAGELLVEAIERESPGEPAREVAMRVAREKGLELGADVRRAEALGRPGPERTLSVAVDVLEQHGFEPYRTSAGEVRLRNCPFHALAVRAPDLVCEMSRAFVDGLLRGFGNDSVGAVLDRRPGECCVALRPPSR